MNFYTRICALIITSCLLSIEVCYNQSTITNNFSYYNFSKADGFSEISVYNVIQTNDGFVYACTASGFYRHNGNRWQQLDSPLDNDEKNISTLLQHIEYDSLNESIYCISGTDVQRYSIKSGKFVRVELPNNFFLSDNIRLTYFDSNLGIVINNALNYYIINKDTLKNWDISSSWPEDLKSSSYDIISIGKDTMVISTRNKLYFYNKNENKLTYKDCQFPQSIKGLVYDKKRQRIWCQTLPYLIYFDLKSGGFILEKESYFTSECRTINITPNDEITISSGSFYDIAKKKWKFIDYQDGRYTNAIQFWPKTLIDKENNQWTTSLGYGMNVLYHPNKYVKNIPLIFDKKYYEPINALSNGKYVFISNTSDGNIVEYDLSTEKLMSYKITNKQLLLLHQIDNNLLIFSNDKNLYTLDVNLKKSKLVDFNDTPLQNISFINYACTYNGKWLIGDENGYYFLNQKDKIIKYTSISLFGHGSHLSSFYDTIKHHYYLIGTKKILKIDLQTESLEELKISTCVNNANSLKNPISVLSHQGNLWVTSRSDGLFKFDSKAKFWINYTQEKNLLTSNFLNFIKPEGENLWIGGDDALQLFDPRLERVIMKLDRQNGFKRDDMGYGLINLPNQLLKFNFSFFDIMDKKALYAKKVPSPMYIMNLEVPSGNLLNVPISYDTTIFLSETNAYPSFEFGTPVYTNSNQQSYSYRLIGHDTTWTHTYDRVASFGALKTGAYTFEVKGFLFNGTPMDGERKIKIIIRPLFFKTWWFILFLISSFGGLIYGLYLLKISKITSEIELKSKYEKQISALEMKALRAQMNPHFIFNSLNSIQKFIFEKDEYSASQYLTKFSRLIRLILDHSNQEFITIGSEIEMLRYYLELEQLRFNESFSYSLQKNNVIDENLMIPSMVIQPHVENAIWHGLLHKKDNAQLLISFLPSSESKAILVIIKDNGVGREKALALKSKNLLKNKSYGSEISKNRIENINSQNKINSSIEIIDIKNDSNEPLGTEVRLNLYTQLNNRKNENL
jgi:hypothetical protein